MNSGNSPKQQPSWRNDPALRVVPRAVMPFLQHRQDSQSKRATHEMSPAAMNSPSSINFDTISVSGSSSFPLIR